MKLADFLFPEPYLLLGVKVKPFTIGHYILLFRIGFNIFKGKIENLEQLILCIFICSRDYNVAWQQLNSKECLDFCLKLHKFFKKKKVDLESEKKVFYQYINEHTQSISYWYKSEEFNRSHSSELKKEETEGDITFIGYIIAYAMAELNMSYHEVLNMPVGCLLTICTFNMARDGTVKIKTEDDEKLINEAKRLTELWNNGQLEVQ